MPSSARRAAVPPARGRATCGTSRSIPRDPGGRRRIRATPGTARSRTRRVGGRSPS